MASPLHIRGSCANPYHGTYHNESKFSIYSSLYCTECNITSWHRSYLIPCVPTSQYPKCSISKFNVRCLLNEWINHYPKSVILEFKLLSALVSEEINNKVQNKIFPHYTNHVWTWRSLSHFSTVCLTISFFVFWFFFWFHSSCFSNISSPIYIF